MLNKPNRKEHEHKFVQLAYRKQKSLKRKKMSLPLFVCDECRLVEHDNTLKGREPLIVLRKESIKITSREKEVKK